MQRNKPQLKVQPLTRYKPPKYPRIGEIDAEHALNDNPYPFRSGFKNYVATVGLTAVFTHLSAADEPVKSGNPFRVAESGLPHQTSPFGTGMPSYLSEELAKRVIGQVFREEGYQLQEDFLFKNEDRISFVADGYDTEKKIGYVWGDWNSLDHRDAIINWARPRLDSESINRIFENSERTQDRYQRILRQAMNYVVRHEGFKTVKDRYEATLEITDPKEKLIQLGSIIEQLKSKEDPERISLREAEELEDLSSDENEYIALISCFDKRFQYRYWGGPKNEEQRAKINKLQEAIRQAKSEEERRELRLRVEAIAAEDALSALEDAVRSYIDWAERQGV